MAAPKYPKTRLGLNSSHCLTCMTKLEHKRGHHAFCSDECVNKSPFDIRVDVNSEIPESVGHAKAQWMVDLEERKKQVPKKWSKYRRK